MLPVCAGGDVTRHNEERTTVVAAAERAVIISYAQSVPATELRVTEVQG